MLLDDPALRRATERRAYRFGRQMTWPHVAGEYGELFGELCSARAARVGDVCLRRAPSPRCRRSIIWRCYPTTSASFSTRSRPCRIERSATAPTMSRARSWSRSRICGSSPADKLSHAFGVDLSRVSAARAARRRPLPQLHELRARVARRDRHAGQLRARDLGARLRHAQRADAGVAARVRARCSTARSPSIESLEYIRSRAYAVLGFAHAYAALTGRSSIADALAISRRRDCSLRTRRTRDDDWQWFENRMTYDNARLPEALIRAGHVLGRSALSAKPGSPRCISTRA